MITVITVVLAVAITLVINSFMEWGIHALMHVKRPLVGYKNLQDDHREQHHGNFTPRRYKSHEYGDHVNIPLPLMIVWVVLMTALSWPVSYFTGNSVVMWSAALTSLLYLLAYNYVHRCFHIPTGRLFERTRLYRAMDRYHHVHHARTDPWGQEVNLCVLFPLADYVMGTRL